MECNYLSVVHFHPPLKVPCSIYARVDVYKALSAIIEHLVPMPQTAPVQPPNGLVFHSMDAGKPKSALGHSRLVIQMRIVDTDFLCFDAIHPGEEVPASETQLLEIQLLLPVLHHCTFGGHKQQEITLSGHH